MLGLVIEQVTSQSYEEYILSLLKEIGVEEISIGFTKKIPSHYMEVSICQRSYRNQTGLIKILNSSPSFNIQAL